MKKILILISIMITACALQAAQPYSLERLREKEAIIDQFIARSGIANAKRFREMALTRHIYLPALEARDELIIVGDSRVALGDFALGGWAKNVKAGNLAVVNFGVSASTMQDWAGRVPLQIIVARNPRAVVIAAGGNDKGDGAPDEAVLGSLQAMIFALKDFTGARVYVHGILPIIQHGSATNQDIKKTNALMKTLCAVNGVSFIDFFDQFNVAGAQTFGTYSFTDVMNFSYLLMEELVLQKWARKGSRPVHLSEAGYRHWFKLLNEYFAAEFATPPKAAQ